ncbi:MAG: glycosyltransferase family 2 protein, partial [Thaumarchaeota archaeon]|nr:glycosyltransferase family 2 protein [Nitrososphaerota archaeon]
TRDGAETIGKTIDSILYQSIPPRFIVVVNDGSSDKTEEIIERKVKSFDKIHLLNTGSKTRDIRKLPRLFNLGLDYSCNFPKVPFMLVSGDDNELAETYVERIIQNMIQDPKLAVASGDWSGTHGMWGEKTPHGGGRLVRTSFMDRVGARYPVAYGWETWLVYKAMQLGYSVKLFPDIRFRHLRPYQPSGLRDWGRAMYSLGYPTYFVLLRFAINFFMPSSGTQNRQNAIIMLAAFLSGKLSPESLQGLLIEDRGLKNYVRYICTARLIRFL